MQKKNVCYCCGEQHKLTDCPKRGTTPKSEWYIQRNPEAKRYNAMVAEIQQALTPAPAPASSGASVSTLTGTATPSMAPIAPEDTWQFFTFNGAGVQDDNIK